MEAHHNETLRKQKTIERKREKKEKPAPSSFEQVSSTNHYNNIHLICTESRSWDSPRLHYTIHGQLSQGKMHYCQIKQSLQSKPEI